MKTICVFLLSAVAVFAELPVEWKNVQTFEATAPGLVKLGLPAETLNAARPGLEDLRIYDADGREVPFLVSRPVRRMATMLTPKKFSTSIVGPTTVILIETGGKHPLEAVTLETPAARFIKAVKVEGSNDQQTWTTLATGSRCFGRRTAWCSCG